MKKPSDAAKTRKRHLRVQSNRDALKLLREGQVKTAFLTVFDRAQKGFRSVKVTLSTETPKNDLVVVTRNGRRSKLELVYYTDKGLTTMAGTFAGYPGTFDVLASVIELD